VVLSAVPNVFDLALGKYFHPAPFPAAETQTQQEMAVSVR
jgi:hypothetical protein